MRRRFEGGKLVVATHNQGKASEIAALLDGHIDDYETAATLNLPEPEETGASFAENAILKAQAAAQASGLPALADDSGLSVKALNGAPGIYSARWAGEPRDFDRAMARVQEELGDNPDRSAAFICVLALAWPDGHVETFEGRVKGELIWPPRGDKGFGYDPMFVPRGHGQTFGEMEPAQKHEISHRADAFRKLASEGM